MVLKKPIYLKVLVKDRFGRLVALVYNANGLVNAQMVRKGQAYYLKKEKVPDLVVSELKLANEYARSKKLGIFGPTCTQTINLDNPKCNIKGNFSSDSKRYLIPGCSAYDKTIVQKYFGDRWFCTEAEAQKAGLTKAIQCP